MEKMPYRPELDAAVFQPIVNQMTPEVATTDWRQRLPVLTSQQVVLRELRPSDAATLFAMLTKEEVSRFISPPPSTVEGFERFIAWTLRQRAAGSYVCFAVTLKGFDTAVGIFQIRELERGFGTAEWGFAIGSPFWGTGVFQEGAKLVIDFAFDTLGVHRLEAQSGGAQRPRQRGAPESRRRPGSGAPPVVSPQRRVSGPGALRNNRGRPAGV